MPNLPLLYNQLSSIKARESASIWRIYSVIFILG